MRRTGEGAQVLEAGPHVRDRPRLVGTEGLRQDGVLPEGRTTVIPSALHGPTIAAMSTWP